MSGLSIISSALSPKYTVLGLLYFQPMHGYDLHRKLESDLHEIWRISQSQVYTLLKRLEAEGLLYASQQIQEKRPDRTCLYLTEDGKKTFLTWLDTPTRPSSRAIRVEFLSRLYFASRMGKDKFDQLVIEQINATQKDLQRLQEKYDATPEQELFSRLGLELRMRQITSILDWLETCKLIQPLPILK